VARHFDADADYVRKDSATLPSGYPFTMAAKIKINSFSTGQIGAFGMYNSSGGSDWSAFEIFNTPSPVCIRMRIRRSSSRFATSNALQTGIWYSAVGIGASATDYRIYIDGVEHDAQTTSQDFPNGLNRIQAGQVGDSSPSNSGRVDVEHCMIWESELSFTDIKRYHRSDNLGNISPHTRVVWWPLNGKSSPEPDYSLNHQDGTVSGSTNIGGGPVSQLYGRQKGLAPLVVPAAGPSAYTRRIHPSLKMVSQKLQGRTG